MKKLLLLLLTTISLHCQNERTIYYFHAGGGSNTWPASNSGADLLNAASYFVGSPGGNYNGGIGSFTLDISGTATLSDGMDYVVSFFDPNTGVANVPLIDANDPGYQSTTTDYVISSYEMPIGQTIQDSGSWVRTRFDFPSYTSNPAYFYLLVPDNADFPEDLTSSNNYLFDFTFYAPTSAASRAGVVLNGEPYWMYRLATSTTTGTFIIGFNNQSQTASTKDYSYAITIYPNPTTSIINIEQDFTTAKVYDISGRELLKSTSKTIDLSELPSSIYLLRLYDKSNRVLGTSKVVKQ